MLSKDDFVKLELKRTYDKNDLGDQNWNFYSCQPKDKLLTIGKIVFEMIMLSCNNYRKPIWTCTLVCIEIRWCCVKMMLNDTMLILAFWIACFFHLQRKIDKARLLLRFCLFRNMFWCNYDATHFFFQIEYIGFPNSISVLTILSYWKVLSLIYRRLCFVTHHNFSFTFKKAISGDPDLTNIRNVSMKF